MFSHNSRNMKHYYVTDLRIRMGVSCQEWFPWYGTGLHYGKEIVDQGFEVLSTISTAV